MKATMELLPEEGPEVTFELESFELVLFSRRDDAPAIGKDERKRVGAEHIAYASAQVAAGNAVLAGAIPQHPQFNGLGLFCTGSLDRVREILDEDPIVVAGIDSYQVMQFVTRKGIVQRPN